MGRSVADSYETSAGSASYVSTQPMFGLHGGGGLEVAFGTSAALDLEARYTHFANVDDATVPGAAQVTGALVFHF